MRASILSTFFTLIGLGAARTGNTGKSDAVSTKVTFVNKHNYYFDVDGNVVKSINGKVDWLDGQYFWITNPSTTYLSKDLVNWVRNSNVLFNVSDPINAEACSGIFGSCSRPKIVYNEKTKKYVFMGFASAGTRPGIPVFTSDYLTHGYIYSGQLIQKTWFYGYGAEDLSLAVIDGEGYLVFTTWNMTEAFTDGMPGSIWPPFSQTVVIEKLTDDFLNSTGESSYVIQRGGDFPVVATSPNLVDGQVESPDLIKRGDWWYMIGSGTCGTCNATTTVAYRGKSWKGPWIFQFVESDDTCGGQGMGVMTVPLVKGQTEHSYLYQADRVSVAPHGSAIGAGTIGHGFWKLNFERDGSIGRIDCSPDAKTTIEAPLSTKAIKTTGHATDATDGSGNNKDYWAESNFPSTFFYQTWTSSKTGNLTTIGVNLAVNVANTPLAVYTFRYNNEAELVAPWTKWEQLSWSPISSLNVTQSFDVVRVPVGAQVKKGDRLGFALTIGYPLKKGPSMPLAPLNSNPWSYLVTDNTGTKTDHILYAGSRDRVSYMEGFKSPIQRLSNRELKWYAEVV